MKTITFLALTTAAIAATEAVVPERFNKERYEETRTTSPFVLATKVEKTDEAPPVNPFLNHFLVGLGKVDGKDQATLVKLGEESKPIRLIGTTPDEDGYSIVQVLWDDKFGASKVRLKKGSDIGDIGFNENAIKQAGTGVPIPGVQQGMRQPGAPNINPPGGANPNFRPPNTPQQQPTTNIPRPTNGSYTPPPTGIPRPPSGTSNGFRPPGGTSAPPTNSNNSQSRSGTRIRVINNK